MAEAESSAAGAAHQLGPDTLAKIREMVSKYPSVGSALLPALWAVQDELGYLPTWSLELVANELHLVPAEVVATSSFYALYFTHEPGRHLVQVCRNVSCGLRGSDQLLRHLERSLGVEDGGSTEDGAFTLEGTVECLGACGGAPMMQVDRYNYENLTPELADGVLAKVRAQDTGVPS